MAKDCSARARRRAHDRGLVTFAAFNRTCKRPGGKPRKRGVFKKCKVGMQAQSVVFSTARYSEKRAKQWLRDHRLTIKKIDRNATQLRFRQFSPSRCKAGQYASIPMGKTGIRKIICCPK